MSIAEPMSPAPSSAPALSPFARMLRIFSRPSEAWVGLSERGQWWFPLLIMIVLEVALSATTFRRVLLPDMFEKWEQQVANGQMQASQLDSMQAFFTDSPAALAWILGSIVLFSQSCPFIAQSSDVVARTAEAFHKVWRHRGELSQAARA